MTLDALAFATIGELRQALDRRSISAHELAASAIDQAETLGRRLNAVVSILPDRAFAEAAAADTRLGRGISAPLLGIPYGAKDLLAAAGAPTTWGSAAFATRTFDFDATVISRLRRAGAVLTAKLALLELAGMKSLDLGSSLMGPCLNPWEPARWAGGSSGGSAAAVAAGIVPFALGSDTGGSIACPSAYCGITGFRPTYGTVSRHGAMPVAWTVDKVGPMARSAEDCALILDAIAGPDRFDESTQAAGRRRRPIPATSALRIGVAHVDFEGRAPEAARRPLGEALAAATDIAGCLVEMTLPELPYAAVHELVTSAERGSAMRPILESGALDASVDAERVASLRASLNLGAADYLDALRVRSRIRAAFATMFREVDVLVAPNFAVPWPPPLATGEGPVVPETGGNAALVFAGNIAGLPAIFLPAGLSEEGLPVGIEVTGPPFADRLLLDLGRRFQEATGWHRFRPPFAVPSSID